MKRQIIRYEKKIANLEAMPDRMVDYCGVPVLETHSLNTDDILWNNDSEIAESPYESVLEPSVPLNEYMEYFMREFSITRRDNHDE